MLFKIPTNLLLLEQKPLELLTLDDPGTLIVEVIWAGLVLRSVRSG